jgi:hypothetical protein
MRDIQMEKRGKKGLKRVGILVFGVGIGIGILGCKTSPSPPSPSLSKLGTPPTHLQKDNKIVIDSYNQLKQSFTTPNPTMGTETSAGDALSLLTALSPSSQRHLKSYYLQKCKNGVGEGCTIAGTLEGNSSLYQEGCLKGDLVGCRLTALFYLKIANRERGAEFYRRGCQLGDGVACVKGGELYLQLGEKKIAKELFQKGCRLGTKIGCDWAKNPPSEEE